MKQLKRLLAFILCLCLAAVMMAPALAAKEEYTYTVRIYAGAQGSFNGAPYIEYTDCVPGQVISFSRGQVALNDGGKYYVGDHPIRESGKDISDATATITVTKDQDFVVNYSVLGEAVAYTINYVDTNGNQLAPSESYYGNVGDKPVVAYLHIEGYQPQYYNLTRTLSENAAENVFDFIYTAIPVAAAEVETTAADETAEGGAAGDEAEDIADEDVPLAEPGELFDLDDEDVPLAGPGLFGDKDGGGIGRSAFVNGLATVLEGARLVVVLVAVAVILAALVWLILSNRRRKPKEVFYE